MLALENTRLAPSPASLSELCHSEEAWKWAIIVLFGGSMRAMHVFGSGDRRKPSLLLTAYLVLSAVWIVGTDFLVRHLSLAPHWHIIKGLVFLLFSSAILFLVSQKTIDSLRRTESTLSRVVRQSEFGVWLADLNGTILDCNEATAHFLGYEVDELVSRNYLDFVDPSEKEEAAGFWVLGSINAESQGRVRRRRFLRRNGTMAWGRIAISKVAAIVTS